MEHPFFTSAAMVRSDALRWLAMAERMLGARDLLGSKSFAERARNADPSLSDADQILAIVDTLLGAERQFVNSLPDWFAVLHLTPLEGLDAGVVSEQFRRLRYLLDPQTNRHPFAEQAFRLIYEAYSNLINSTRRSLYDAHLGLYSQPPPPQQLQQLLPDPFNAHIPSLPLNFISFGGGGGGGVAQQLVHGKQSGGIGGNNSAQEQQVHVQPKVAPVDGGSTLQPHNFMGFPSGHKSVLGSGSTSAKSGHETDSNHEQFNYSNFGVGSDVVSASETTQSLHNFSNVSDETIHNVNVSENFGTMEGKEDVEVVDDHVAEEDELEKEEEEVGKEEEKGDESASSPENVVGKEEEKGVESANSPVVGDGSSFWTACPYCYIKYEYPQEYVDCALRCQACQRAFQAEVILSPPQVEEKDEEKEEERTKSPVVGDGSTFWTACPYCYYMYEYPQEYVDCALKCQNCKKAFQAVGISSPPPIVEGQESYCCCWGVLPFGFSMEDWKKHNAGAYGWAPFTPMFSSMQILGNNFNKGVDGVRGLSPKVNVDNNENYVVISDSCESDKDWQGVRSKYEKNVKGKKAAGKHGRRAKKARPANIQDGIVSPQGADLPKTSELNKMRLVANAGMQPGCTKLDLNVELSIETEEHAIRRFRTHQSSRREDDNVEGNGLFEGLDEFLSSLPVLDGVGDNKVVKVES